jgi:hypothetical protein
MLGARDSFLGIVFPKDQRGPVRNEDESFLLEGVGACDCGPE